MISKSKAALMRKLGKKQLALHLQTKLDSIPAELAGYPTWTSRSNSSTHSTHKALALESPR